MIDILIHRGSLRAAHTSWAITFTVNFNHTSVLFYVTSTKYYRNALKWISSSKNGLRNKQAQLIWNSKKFQFIKFSTKILYRAIRSQYHLHLVLLYNKLYSLYIFISAWVKLSVFIIIELIQLGNFASCDLIGCHKTILLPLAGESAKVAGETSNWFSCRGGRNT